MDIVLRPPPVAKVYAPIKVTGKGTLEVEDDGLHVSGFTVGSSPGRTFGIIGGLVVFGVVLWVAAGMVGLSTKVSTLIAMAAAAAVFIPVSRMPAKEGEPITHVFPWGNVKKVVWDSPSECLVVVIKGMSPKGGLFILQPEGSELQQRLEAKIAAAA